MEIDESDELDESEDARDGTDEAESDDARRCFSGVFSFSFFSPRFHFSARTPFFLLRPACTRFMRPLCFLIQW